MTSLVNISTDQRLQVAKLYGQPVANIPEDLFIPPDALAVFLETFEGPLDLLLYLIRKQNIDILNIPMVQITRQYLQYIDILEEARFERAADYLLMAAMLIDIKARLLLPKPPASDDDEEESDPRAELVRRLLEYEKTQLLAKALCEHPQNGVDFLAIQSIHRGGEHLIILPSVSNEDLMNAWQSILKRASMNRRHVVARESLSVREHMVTVLKRLSTENATKFIDLFDEASTLPVLVIYFLAILELLREQLIDFVQAAPGSTIYLTLRQTDHAQSSKIY